ncbi:MAG: RHS repeat protein [Chloroflexi bacterium]|nr:MAG: RHS repeat protein [Chloroflexota bacterium]
MTAPFTTTWNSVGATNASHSFTAKAYDDAGNATTSAAVTATINNNPAPTTTVTSPGSSVTGTVNVSATAAAASGLSVSKVEFYADDTLFGTSTTSPYTAPWNTLDATQPAFDGSHTLTTRVYDSSGLIATSTGATTAVANTASSQYKATFTSNTNVPLAVVYDPTLQTQATYPVKVTVTNNSSLTWSTSNTYLRYRWYSPDATPVITDGPNVVLPANVTPGASSSQIQLNVTPPTLPDGIDAAQYQLRIDLFDSTGNVLFSAKGNQPLDNPVIVNKALKAALGLERYYDYVGQNLGAGVQSLVNVANGNSMLRWEPFNIPGRGMATVMGMTYNSREEHSDSPAGSNFSLSISTLSRFGEPIDIHPNDADSIAGRANRWIQFIDGDGTPHKFIGAQAGDGTIYWSEPTGVHLYLRQYSTTDTNRWWAFTRPDRVTFFYNQAGYPTYVTDRNGNTISFTLSAVAPADDPGGPKFHITQVIDAAGQGGSPAPNRAFNISYYVKADKVKSHVRGRIKTITDHIGHALDFTYYDDGNLLRIVQRGGVNADGSFLASRSLVFTYTTSSGAGPAIPTASARLNPDPKTPNESTRLYSEMDPNGHETTFSYITSGQDKWKLLTLTDRAGNTTNYSYDNVNLTTTVAAPTPGGQTARTTRYTYDVNGKPVTITDPLSRQTQLQWTADFTVSQITEPGGAVSKYNYNNNGYMTDRYDALNNHSSMIYTNSQVDGNDVSGKWVSGRTAPHVSDLSTKTDPKGYPWQFAYDANGNVTQVTDPLNDISKNVYNSDGTIANTIDANNHTTTYPSYDANGKSTKVVDPKGNATTFVYNDDGLLLSVQDAKHQANSGGDPRQYRTFYDYDSFNRLGRQSTPKLTGDSTHLVWIDTAFDANGNAVWTMAPHYGSQDTLNGDKTTTSYDVMDRPTLRTVPDFSVDANGERTQYDYDVAGRLIKVTEPKGVATTNTANDYATFTTYDALDRSLALTQYLVDPTTGAIQSTLVSQSCYNTPGDKVAVTSPNAGAATVNCAALPTNTTKYTYDADHRILSITDPMGNVRSKTYDVNGNVATATDANGKQTTLTYDKLNRQVQATQPLDSSVAPTRTITSKTAYDAAGNKTQDISPRAYDASSDKVTFNNYVTTYHYDELNRLTRTDLPVDTAYPTAYYVHQAYDAVGNATMNSLPVTTTDPTQVTPSQKTTVTYFDTGWIQTSKDPANPRLHFDYVAQGWQSSRVPEDASGNLDTSHQMFTYYLADGQVLKKTDIHGDPTTYIYDLNDQMTSADSAGGIYDPSQAPTHMDVTYDTLGRVTKSRSKKTTDANFTYTKFTTYDLDGNLTDNEQNGVETPAGALVTAGRTVHDDYNAAGWLINQFDYGTKPDASDDQKIVNAYTPAGLEKTREQYNTVNSAWNKKQVTNWTYFDNGSLKTMNTTNGPGTSTLESHTVSYVDASNIYVNGNRTKDVSMLKGPNNPSCATSCTGVYTYDPRDRLAQEDNGHGTVTKYDLDGAGNILTEYLNGTVSKTSTYLGNELQTTTQGGATSKYWYTPDANLDCVTTASGSQADCSPSQGVTPSANLQQDYAYDALNRLSSYRAFNATGTLLDSASYVYDALDRTVSERETHQGKTPRNTSFTYRGLSKDTTQEVQKDDGGTLITTKDYTYDAYGHRLSMTNTPNGQASQTFTYGYNVHDSVSQLIDTNGNATTSYGYRPYGDPDTGQTQAALRSGHRSLPATRRLPRRAVRPGAGHRPDQSEPLCHGGRQPLELHRMGRPCRGSGRRRRRDLCQPIEPRRLLGHVRLACDRVGFPEHERWQCTQAGQQSTEAAWRLVRQHQKRRRG